MQARRIQTVFFDWSGVISNDIKPVYETNMRMLEARGKKRMTFEEWKAIQPTTLLELLANSGIVVTQDEVDHWFNETYRQLSARRAFTPIIYPDVKEVLEVLKAKDIKLAVVSAHSRDVLFEEAVMFGIASFFSIFCGWSSAHKENALTRTCIELKVDPRKTVYIADTIHDIESARKAEMLSAAVSTGYNTYEALKQAKPDFLVRSLTEFVQVIDA